MSTIDFAQCRIHKVEVVAITASMGHYHLRGCCFFPVRQLVNEDTSLRHCTGARQAYLQPITTGPQRMESVNRTNT